MHVQILGCRGIPASHGGFETFAENLALFLTRRGHQVTVYCQGASSDTEREDFWRGVRRVHFPAGTGVRGTIHFDWRCVNHSCREDGTALTLGYNTAVFSLVYRLRGHKNVMNMDGLEWKRDKWSVPAKAWLLLNEWLGARLAHHLVADHPAIAEHLARHTPRSKISIIPYGSRRSESIDPAMLQQFGLVSKQYYLMIARPEPENSILEVVSGYSSRKRSRPLVVLGRYRPDTVPYHAAVMRAAGPNVRFLGGIYDQRVVTALRQHALVYLHGHRVGGTNPSLVESLAAANPIIAHDNRFTRWVAGEAAVYFRTAKDVDELLERFENAPESLNSMAIASGLRHEQTFGQERVLTVYETLLARFSPVPEPAEVVYQDKRA